MHPPSAVHCGSGEDTRGVKDGEGRNSYNRETVSASRVLDARSGLPQFLRHHERIDFALLPPSPLITGRVIFAVVDGAERHGEFIAHFERKPSRLRIANMMGMGGGAAAD